MKQDKRPLLTGYGKYSGVAFQMGLLIFLGTFGGIKLDEKLDLSSVYFNRFPRRYCSWHLCCSKRLYNQK